MKLIKIILEIIGWLQIIISVTLLAGLFALVTYLIWNNETGKIAAVIIVFIGFILGSIWATRIWKKYGTITWLSRIGRVS